MDTEIITVGVTEEITNPLIRAYPTLFNHSIQVEGVSDAAIINVFGIGGELVLSTTPNNLPMDLSHFQNGLYILEILDGDQRHVTKIVKY